MRYPYTRKNLTEAAKVVAESAGVERRSSDAMLDLANMGLPEFLKFAAQEFFVWGEEPSGPTLTAVTMVRRALKQLSREGAFKFEDVPAEEVVRTSGSFL
jgi:hypothetical protein